MFDERQMSMFEEGGMSAPEVKRDPASGNDVPPGSLPEEVRDDVDAKLSSGEYVVPADVLRYYGMKFFEDLRTQAKKSLAEMDSQGRIGGQPMTDQKGTPEGLSEEEMRLLQEIMAEGGEPQFNQGGMVQRNPEFYAEGGMTNPPAFNPSQWSDVGSSYLGSQRGSSGIETGSYYKTYVGPNGETRLILFINGQPSTPIPEGFTEQKTAADAVQEETAKEEVERDTGDSDQRREAAREDLDTAKSWAEENYEAISSDPIGFGMEQLKGNFGDKLAGKAPLIGMAVAGPLGVLGGAGIAAVTQIHDIASARSASLMAQAQGLDTTELDNEIETRVNDLPRATRTLINDFGAGTGQNLYDSLVNVGNTVPSYVRQTEAAFRSSRTPDEASNRAREIVAQFGGDGGSNEGGSNEVRTEQARTTEGTVSTIGGTGEGNAGVSVRSGSAAPTESSRPQGRPNMNKGGLVKRRPKKSKK
jgi:hypothetical protein